jgi:hypothetical protein
MTNLLPENLIRNALDLQCIGVRELAWQYDFVFDVLKVFERLFVDGHTLQRQRRFLKR